MDTIRVRCNLFLNNFRINKVTKVPDVETDIEFAWDPVPSSPAVPSLPSIPLNLELKLIFFHIGFGIQFIRPYHGHRFRDVTIIVR